MDRDIILSSFNCGGSFDCKEQAKLFDEEPVIVFVPGSSSSGFRQTAQKYNDGKSVLDKFLAKYLPKDVTPRRVCLASFSAGWRFSTGVLDMAADRSRVDCALVLDGIHTESLDGWKAFAELAGVGGKSAPKLWMPHTQIKPPFVSTTTTNTRIIDHARNIVGSGDLLAIPEYIALAKLDKKISVYSSIVRPHTKFYEEDSLEELESVGNISRFEYSGNLPQDHIYNAQHTQPRFWRWLRELWLDTSAGVFFKGEK